MAVVRPGCCKTTYNPQDISLQRTVMQIIKYTNSAEIKNPCIGTINNTLDTRNSRCNGNEV
jgi:hypothetical protein